MPSVLLFNNNFFIEAFPLENKKKKEELLVKAHVSMQQYSPKGGLHWQIYSRFSLTPIMLTKKVSM